ncbi:hypothetical protein O3Q52_05790 [Streptomyces sp. ActVer]|uniref:hypothetical protein n=1 Tax=Streptomyces sp. ActVer TaxID=3014558 RepID=UPI0022B2FBDD|nr:hypothetical protein [Streptomyces sp. ActVer]MCZ4507730.1 hypothetical protein [Streptomyces sp. ActVer]
MARRTSSTGFAKRLDEASSVTESMSNLSRAAALDVAAVLDTKGVDLALDIGGAGGTSSGP